MNFVDRNGSVERVVMLAGLHPAVIAPVVIDVPDDRGRPRRDFVLEGIWVGLVDAVSLISRGDVVLVDGSVAYLRDEAFPNAGVVAWPQVMAVLVPAIKVADHRYRVGIGGPHREISAVLPASLGQVRAQLVMEAVVVALIEQVEVVVAQQREVVAHGAVLNV